MKSKILKIFLSVILLMLFSVDKISAAKVDIPWKRLMTLQVWDTTLGTKVGPPLGDQTGWTEAEIKTRIGYLLDELEYMNVDAFSATVRAAYFEAARDPNGYYPNRKDITKSQIDTRASWDMFGYLISESHKRGIKVIWWHDPIYYGTANIYLWGDKYNECTYLNLSTSVCRTRRPRMEVDEPVVKAYNYNLVKYVLENYDIDGIDLHEPFYVNPSYNPVIIKRVKDKYNWDITGAVYTEFSNSLLLNGKCSRNSTVSLVNDPACPNIGKLYDVEGDVWEELFAGYRQIYNTSNKKNPNVLLGGGGHHRYKVVHGINIADVISTGNLDYYSSEDINIVNTQEWKDGMIIAKALFGQDFSWSMGLILNLDNNNPSVGSNSNFGVQAGLSCEYGSAYLHLYPFNRRNFAFGTANSDTMYNWAHMNPPSSFCGSLNTPTATPVPTSMPITTPTPTPTPTLKNNLTLTPGWNQISSPITEGIDMSTIENSCSIVAYNNQKLWGWDTQTRSWINPSRVEPFKGYWINSARACTITLSGTPATFTSVQLYTGWNKISASGSLNNIKGTCNIVDNWIWNWDAVNKSWTHPSTLQPDKGYWIRVTGSCTLD